MPDPPVPPPAVLAAFGAPDGRPRRMAGGQGRAWRAGAVVLKPTGDEAEANWRAAVLAGWPPDAEPRVAPPVRAGDGRWVVDGWEAWRLVAGAPDETRVEQVLAAGEAFHRALAHLPRPAFLDRRDDPWTHGERLAFHEIPLTGGEVMAPLLARLDAAWRPVPAAAQLVHGDLLGNVLFADPLPPAVIDWPVYHRPAAWASAVAVIDAVTWCGAAPRLIADERGDDWVQMLIRALMYRIGTADGARRHGLAVREGAQRYHPVVQLVLDRVTTG